MIELTSSGYGVFFATYHICWITKYRRRILNPGLVAYLKKLFPKILREMPGVKIKEVGTDIDHVHLVMVIPPKYRACDVVARIKSQTASRLRKKFLWLEKVYWKENVVWSPGYFLSTIGVDEETIRKYVAWQGRQDLGQAKLQL